MIWPWLRIDDTAPQRATATAKPDGLPPGVIVDYGPAVHALEVLEQRNAADIRALKTEWLDHAARMETLVRKLLKLRPGPNGHAEEATPAQAGVVVVTRADLLRAHRAKGGRT